MGTRDERGATMTFMALTLTILVTFVSFVVDLGNVARHDAPR